MSASEAFDPALFEKNLELFAKVNPTAALQLSQVLDFYEIQTCETEKGEPNLFKHQYGINDYYHAQSGALQEALDNTTPELAKADVIYFYGLGLGYIYDSLKFWLHANPKNQLVFLENDLEVLYYFFHTARATDVLQDPQVTLFYFREYKADFASFLQLHSNFVNRKVDFLTLPYYALRRELEASSLCYTTFNDLSLVTNLYNEYMTGQSGFLGNFYRNFLHLADSKAGNELFGKFKGIPAIICGAGPSLHKNISLLKTLKDRALIFAGGSSLNVLNAAGIIPHFGLGVDPNREQYHRLLTNDTFHLPYFYRPRVSTEALRLMPGPKLYVPGSVNLLAHWFEKQLGMDIPILDEGHNVVNLCTEIVNALGCSPVIYVGMDLAYSDIKSYASGIHTHPLWLDISHPYAPEGERLARRLDMHRQWVKTRWDWITESNWLSHYAAQNPSLPMINATEGGLGFSPIPNMSLQDVKERYLTKNYDLENLVHTEIQNCTLNITQTKLFALLNEMQASLKRCVGICQEILKDKILHLNQESASQPPFYNAETILKEVELHQEIAYEYFLRPFEDLYFYILRSSSEIKGLKNAQDFYQQVRSFKFLNDILEQHLHLMAQGVSYFIHSPSLVYKQSVSPTPVSETALYCFENHVLQIEDPTLQLSIQEEFYPDSQTGCERLFYSDSTQLKQETYYQEGQMHGPSRFYGPSGTLLAETWFYKGQRQGKSLHYYASGKLYSRLHYREGMLQGSQEYFYENGALYVTLFYQEDKLEGRVAIYNKEGQILRELYYTQGQRQGTEKMWNLRGQLILECTYEKGIPVGKASQWDSKGNLMKEMIIHQFPHDFDSKRWDITGQVVQSYLHGIEDFTSTYQSTQENVITLQTRMQSMMEQINSIIQEKADPSQENYSKIMQEVEGLKQSMQEMEHLKEQLSEKMISNLKQTEELRNRNKEDHT